MPGVLAAILSTALGGTAIVATRLLAGAADPITWASGSTCPLLLACSEWLLGSGSPPGCGFLL